MFFFFIYQRYKIPGKASWWVMQHPCSRNISEGDQATLVVRPSCTRMQEIRCHTHPSLGSVWELTQVVPSPSPRSSVLPNPTFNLFNDRRDKQMVGRWAVDGFLLRFNPSLCPVNRKRIETSVKGGGRWKPATKGSRCREFFLICKRSGGGEE